ncbi:MAG: hypothetical protein QOF73_3172 [Thermomicrobiales bacterium]|nr:hypothetical protein [Thermomicrobiales bacterium]
MSLPLSDSQDANDSDATPSNYPLRLHPAGSISRHDPMLNEDTHRYTRQTTYLAYVFPEQHGDRPVHLIDDAIPGPMARGC